LRTHHKSAPKGGSSDACRFVTIERQVRTDPRGSFRNWSLPPAYVLLVGTGTFDCKDNEGYANNRMPTIMTSTFAALFSGGVVRLGYATVGALRTYGSAVPDRSMTAIYTLLGDPTLLPVTGERLMDPVYRQADDIVTRKVADETLLVPIRGNMADLQRIFALDPVGETVWGRIDGDRGFAELVAAVVEAFDVAPHTARADVREFLGELEAAGLVVRVH